MGTGVGTASGLDAKEVEAFYASQVEYGDGGAPAVDGERKVGCFVAFRVCESDWRWVICWEFVVSRIFSFGRVAYVKRRSLLSAQFVSTIPNASLLYVSPRLTALCCIGPHNPANHYCFLRKLPLFSHRYQLI